MINFEYSKQTKISKKCPHAPVNSRHNPPVSFYGLGSQFISVFSVPGFPQFQSYIFAR